MSSSIFIVHEPYINTLHIWPEQRVPPAFPPLLLRFKQIETKEAWKFVIKIVDAYFVPGISKNIIKIQNIRKNVCENYVQSLMFICSGAKIGICENECTWSVYMH